MAYSDAPVVTEALLIDQLGESYKALKADQRFRYVQMLESIQQPEDVALDVHTDDGKVWDVTVCTWDCIGSLSLMSGLFAAYRLDIFSVDVFTVHLPQSQMRLKAGREYWRTRRLRRLQSTGPALPNRKILDLFQVRPLGVISDDTWARFKEELGQLTKLLVQGKMDPAREMIIDRISEVFMIVGDTERQLFPVTIDLSNDVSPDFSYLSIHSADTLGFLFAFANALTMLNVNIERAEIRTKGSEVYDIFWLTDASGHKIEAGKRSYEIQAAAALMKQFTYLLPRSPNPALALRQFNALTHQMLSNPDWTEELHNLESATVLETMANLMGISQFLWEDFLRMQHENLFPVLVDVPALGQHRPKEYLKEALRQNFEGCPDYESQVQELNRFKDREMFRIDLRHITGHIDFRGFSGELTDLAEVVVGEAVELSHRELGGRFGVPHLATGGRCSWVACALGKFGGRELGFGSDIELIFVYEGEGQTDGAEPIETSRYFNDFVRAFLGVLKTRREGIFEIDLRLRPYGDHGALASSCDAFMEYYSGSGFARQFERMALVRLRPFAGDLEFGKRVVATRDAFVYSGAPLDVENILHLRRRQAMELVPQGAVSAKYSQGGLVEVEYFVQLHQILAGYKDPEVRVANTLDAVDRLARGAHISAELAVQLRDIYGFLRRLIDALRVVRGHARDLTIPPQDSREFAYLTQRLQYLSPAELGDAITSKMRSAQELWESHPLA